MFNQRTDKWEIAFLWLVVYRLVEVEECADHGLIVHVFGYGAETVILRHGGEIVLAVILPGVSLFPRCVSFT